MLVQTKSIRSLRDLTPDHLPLLNKIRSTTQAVVKDKFDVDKDKIRLFVHYQPSYCTSHILFHLHPWRCGTLTRGQITFTCMWCISNMRVWRV